MAEMIAWTLLCHAQESFQNAGGSADDVQFDNSAGQLYSSCNSPASKRAGHMWGDTFDIADILQESIEYPAPCPLVS